MSKALDELKELITGSPIPIEEQNDLLVFLPILPEETMENLVKVFKTEPEKLRDFNSNFKAKVQAITGENDEEWDKIIEEEEKAAGEISEEEEETAKTDGNVLQDNTYDEENPEVG